MSSQSWLNVLLANALLTSFILGALKREKVRMQPSATRQPNLPGPLRLAHRTAPCITHTFKRTHARPQVITIDASRLNPSLKSVLLKGIALGEAAYVKVRVCVHWRVPRVLRGGCACIGALCKGVQHQPSTPRLARRSRRCSAAAAEARTHCQCGGGSVQPAQAGVATMYE